MKKQPDNKSKNKTSETLRSHQPQITIQFDHQQQLAQQIQPSIQPISLQHQVNFKRIEIITSVQTQQDTTKLIQQNLPNPLQHQHQQQQYQQLKQCGYKKINSNEKIEAIKDFSTYQKEFNNEQLSSPIFIRQESQSQFENQSQIQFEIQQFRQPVLRSQRQSREIIQEEERKTQPNSPDSSILQSHSSMMIRGSKKISKKGSTKNVPKNYINAFSNFISQQGKVLEKIEQKIQEKGFSYSQFCQYYMELFATPTIQNLKKYFGKAEILYDFGILDITIEQQNYYSYILRCLMYKFLQQESFAYFINNKKMRHGRQMLKFKSSFMYLIHFPNQFQEIRTSE